MLERVVRVLAFIIVVSLLGLGILVFVAGGPPPPRPDLVRLPGNFPPPPEGYRTRPLMTLAYHTGQVDLMKIPEQRLPDGVSEELNLIYGTVNDQPLKLDLFRRDSENKPVPGVIFVHGGGWSGGEKEMLHYYASRIAAEGYVGISVGYRTSGEAAFPAAIQDVNRAIRWTRKNAAQYNIDPGRLYLAGSSAGAHLALLAAYAPEKPELAGTGDLDVSSRVSGVVSLYGPSLLTAPNLRDNSAVRQFLNVSYEEDPQRYILASPLTHLDASDPPTVIVHGTIDAVLPVAQSDRLAEELQAINHPYWYDRLEGWPHSLDVARLPNERVLALLKRFLAEGINAE